MPTGYDFTEKDVINILKEKECELIGKYNNSRDKITMKDKYGYKYYGTFIMLKKGKLDKPFTKANPYTIENINNWIVLNGYDNIIELLSPRYISATDKLEWKCKLCNTIFERDWHTMHKQNTNKSCKKCNELRRTVSQTHFDSKQLFIDDGYKILSKYKGKHTYVVLQDNEGYKYRTKYSTYITNNKNITKFHICNPYTIENIKQWIINSGNDDKIELLSDVYIGQNECLMWLCKRCNKSFKRTLADMIQEIRNKYCYDCCMKLMGERKVNLQREQEIIEVGYTLLTPYINATTYIDIIDECGYKYRTIGANFNRGELLKFHSNNPHTIKNINNYIKLNNINIKLLSDIYLDSKSSLLWKCNCGQEFKRCWNSIYSQNQIYCSDCIKEIIKEKVSLSQDFINNEFIEYGYIVLSKYNGINNQLHIVDKLGYRYYTSYSSFKQTHNVSIFNSNNPYTVNNINLWIQLNNIPVKLISTEYIDSKTYMVWECECGDRFKATWGQVLSTKRYKCEKCSKYQSKIARATEDYLKELGLFYLKEYKFSGCKDILCLPFDFAIFNDKNKLLFLIETDGVQHYTPVCFKENHTEQDKIDTYNYIHHHDEIKNKYCDDNNMKLLRLPYWFFDKYDKYKSKINNMFE